MAGGPKYNRFAGFLHDMRMKEINIRKSTINVKEGKGKYPECLPGKQYAFCPKETPENPENVPHDCKQCPQFVNSKFYSDVYMIHDRRIEMLRKRGLPLVLGSKK